MPDTTEDGLEIGTIPGVVRSPTATPGCVSPPPVADITSRPI